jgi:hypothetical protein
MPATRANAEKDNSIETDAMQMQILEKKRREIFTGVDRNQLRCNCSCLADQNKIFPTFSLYERGKTMPRRLKHRTDNQKQGRKTINE